MYIMYMVMYRDNILSFTAIVFHIINCYFQVSIDECELQTSKIAVKNNDGYVHSELPMLIIT